MAPAPEQGGAASDRLAVCATPGRLTSPLSVEDMIESCIGCLTWSQIVQAILVGIASLFDGQQTFISIFTDAVPKWHCVRSAGGHRHHHVHCNPRASNICHLPRDAWAWDRGNGHGHHATIISEWGLECASSFITGLPATSYFIGSVLGGFLFSMLGDSSLGRKKLLFLSSFSMSVAALACAFSTNVWMYSGFRFLTGLGRASITTTALVLLTERVGKQRRGQLVMIGFFSYTFGLLSLPGIAYFSASRRSSWKAIYIWTSVPAALYSVLAYLFVLESPRWLFMQGREADAMAVLKKIGATRHVNYPLSSAVVGPSHSESNHRNPYHVTKVLLKKRWAVKRLMSAMALGFGIGMMYFGMFLGVGNLGLNIYLSTTFNALLSLPSYLITFPFWLQRCDRKPSLLGFCIISGASSIACSLVLGHHHCKLKGVELGLELVSYFCACMSYNVLLMYVMEMFPTCVRSSASSLVRQALIIGSVFDPILITAGRKKRFLSYGVFGVVMITCGLTVLCLPETRGKTLCDTMEEQECRDSSTSSFDESTRRSIVSDMCVCTGQVRTSCSRGP